MRPFLSSLLLAAGLAGPAHAADNARAADVAAIKQVVEQFKAAIVAHDGKVTNRGSETWQMVRGEDGWKIAAMPYSMGK